jgi:hypothetical protein
MRSLLSLLVLAAITDLSLAAPGPCDVVKPAACTPAKAAVAVTAKAPLFPRVAALRICRPRIVKHAPRVFLVR